jgi:hypothetical protein
MANGETTKSAGYMKSNDSHAKLKPRRHSSLFCWGNEGVIW